MSPRLLHKEMLALIRDGRVPGAVLLLALLCGGVFAIFDLGLRDRVAERAEVEAVTRAQWDQQGDKNPHRGAHFGLYAFAPEGALAAYEPGVGPHVGRAIWLEPHRRNMARYSDVLDDPVSHRFEAFTPAFMVVVLLPLLIGTIAAGSIAGERELGLLRMLRAATPRLQTYVWSKFAVLVMVSGVLLSPLLVLLAWRAMGQGGDGLARVALLGGSALAYCGVFAALGLAMSAWSKNARVAVAIVVAIWAGSVFVVPRSAAAVAASMVELPTQDMFWAAIRADYQRGLPGDADLATRNARFDEQLLARFGVDSLEALPVGGYALRRLERDAYADRVHAIHFRELWERFERQQSLARRVGMLSPSTSMRLLGAAYAGTDLAHRRDFEEAAEAYRQQVNTLIDEWDAANTRGLRSFEDAYAGDALWQAMPRFDYSPPSVAYAWGSARLDALVLAAWLAASLLLLGGAARRLQ